MTPLGRGAFSVYWLLCRVGPGALFVLSLWAGRWTVGKFIAIVLFFLFTLTFTKARCMSTIPTTSVAMYAMRRASAAPRRSVGRSHIVPLSDGGKVTSVRFKSTRALTRHIDTSTRHVCHFSSVRAARFVGVLLHGVTTQVTDLTDYRARICTSSCSLP